MALTNSKGDGKGIKVGNDTQRIIEESFKILNGQGKTGTYLELWDGHTSERIISILTFKNYKLIPQIEAFVDENSIDILKAKVAWMRIPRYS